MKKTNVIIFLLVLFMVAVFSQNGFCGADDKEDKEGKKDKEEKVFAVQNKLFHRFHEIAFTTGYGPDEDFYNPYPLGVSYTYHFNDWIAWEVFNAKWLWNQEKDLKKRLQNDFWVSPEAFDEPKYMAHTNLVFKPLYGKQAVWNRSVINQESYFLIGGGMMSYKLHYSPTRSESDTTENSPSVSLGIGTKFFLNQNLCLNFEVRDLVNFRDSDIDNRIWLGVGIGFRFNFTPRQTTQETEAEDFTDYLKREK